MFSEKIFYDIGTTTLEGPEQRNGNIAHLYWQVAGKTPKGYGFTYDPINRLLQGIYGEVVGNGGISQIIKSERYSAYGITYDADGNLETLTRNGPIGTCPSGLEYGVIDQLDYTIVGNRMTSLADAATRDGYFPGLSSSYGYDGAGNMNSVGPTGVTLTYNALNLPQTANNGMAWDYSADGRKIKYTGLTDETKYADGIEYLNDEDIFIYHPEGRVYKDTAGEWRFEYSLKDHLGNTRVVFADVDRDGIIVDTIDVLREAHYYPFGMEMVGPWSMTSDTLHPYLYNGKEFNHDSTDVDNDGKNELALGWYDYGARFYDPSVGRFTSVDPLADKMRSWSPFNYTYNNPLRFIDPTGMAPNWIPKHDKENNRINLVAEQGDNEASLKQWANGAFSDQEISQLYSSMQDGKIDLSNTFIGAFAEGFEANQDKFNCFSCVVSGLSGVDKSEGYGENDQSGFDPLVSSGELSESSLYPGSLDTGQPFRSAFGYTVQDSDGNFYSDGRLDHVEINAGKDRSGTTWVLTKDGYNAPLQFQEGTKYGLNQRAPDKIYKKK